MKLPRESCQGKTVMSSLGLKDSCDFHLLYLTFKIYWHVNSSRLNPEGLCSETHLWGTIFRKDALQSLGAKCEKGGQPLTLSRHWAAPAVVPRVELPAGTSRAKASWETDADVKTGSDAAFCCLTGVHPLSCTSGVDLCALEWGEIKAEHMELTHFT